MRNPDAQPCAKTIRLQKAAHELSKISQAVEVVAYNMAGEIHSSRVAHLLLISQDIHSTAARLREAQARKDIGTIA